MFINPYQEFDENARPLRANFHTHAGTGKNTCGHYPIREVLRNYNRIGYDVICLSNHDMFTNPKFHGWNTPNIMLLPGYEYSKNPHVVCVCTNHVVRGADRQQDAITSTLNDGGFAILAHPHWHHDYYTSKELLLGLKGYAGIEIFNGSMDDGIMVYKEKEHRAEAGDAFDFILSNGLLKWAFANDDFHRWWSFARAWNMVYSDKNPEAFKKAIKEGKFYASTGVSLRYLKLKDGVISVSARTGEAYIDPNMEYKFIGFNGEILAKITGTHAEYKMRGDEKYVRLEITSAPGHKLFTNPIYDSDFFNK